MTPVSPEVEMMACYLLKGFISCTIIAMASFFAWTLGVSWSLAGRCGRISHCSIAHDGRWSVGRGVCMTNDPNNLLQPLVSKDEVIAHQRQIISLMEKLVETYKRDEAKYQAVIDAQQTMIEHTQR